MKNYPDPDVLIAILKYKRDLDIVLKNRWYRIPKKSAPKELKSFLYIAFYQPSCFGEDKWKVRYYSKIKEFSIVKRVELLPEEPKNPNAHEDYYKIELYDIRELRNPIINKKGRRLVFIPTTIEKLLYAEEINDCFHGSPLEDILWNNLKANKIKAQRNVLVLNKETEKFIQLDFALYCNNSKINTECDGDSWHIKRANAVKDNRRDNYLTSIGWNILRFSTKQIEREMPYNINILKKMIEMYGGLIE